MVFGVRPLHRPGSHPTGRKQHLLCPRVPWSLTPWVPSPRPDSCMVGATSLKTSRSRTRETPTSREGTDRSPDQYPPLRRPHLNCLSPYEDDLDGESGRQTDKRILDIYCGEEQPICSVSYDSGKLSMTGRQRKGSPREPMERPEEGVWALGVPVPNSVG